jgi:hypothetical protein
MRRRQRKLVRRIVARELDRLFERSECEPFRAEALRAEATRRVTKASN